MITNDTYYDEDEREALKDLYSPHNLHVNCVNKVLAGKHVLIVGETGRGKSFFMSKVCEYLPSFIFVNPQYERVVDDITQVATENEDEVIELLEDGYRKIQFLPSEDDEEAIEQLKSIRLDLWAVAKNMNIKDGGWWINLIVDECDIFAPLGSRTDIQNVARRGRRYGVKLFALTQQPQDLAKGIVNNCSLTVIFQLGTFAEPYYKRFHIPIEEEREWLKRDYHYILWDKNLMQRCTPV
jgi:hypothetical protein